MGVGVAIAGWLSAVLAVLIGVQARRSRGATMEAVARVCHELRGPVTAARLGLQLGARTAELSPARLRAIDLELGRAALALDDLREVGRPSRPIRGWELVNVAELLADSIEIDLTCPGVELELSWSGPLGERLGRPSPARAGDAQPDRERDRARARADRGVGPSGPGRRPRRGGRQRPGPAGARRRTRPPPALRTRSAGTGARDRGGDRHGSRRPTRGSALRARGTTRARAAGRGRRGPGRPGRPVRPDG